MADMEILVPITVSENQYRTLAYAAEANGFGDLTVRQAIEIWLDLQVDTFAGDV